MLIVLQKEEDSQGHLTSPNYPVSPLSRFGLNSMKPGVLFNQTTTKNYVYTLKYQGQGGGSSFMPQWENCYICRINIG